jgi:alkyl hydroperoxide reductase subunit AhpF
MFDSTCEKEIFEQGFRSIVGIDEMGRGPMAGDVTHVDFKQITIACVHGTTAAAYQVSAGKKRRQRSDSAG